MLATRQQPNFFEPEPAVSSRELPVRIVILGEVPSKKNSKQLVTIKAKPPKNPSKKKWKPYRTIVLPSEHYQEWEKDALKQIQWADAPLPGGVRVEITIYASTRRLADLTNKAESILDALVKATVLTDDNWDVVPKVILDFGGVDRLQPRAEIVIGRANV